MLNCTLGEMIRNLSPHVLLVPFSCSSLIKRLWRSWREKSRDTELRPSSCRMDKASSGNSSNFLSASSTTYSPGPVGNLSNTHTKLSYDAALFFFTLKSLRCFCTVTVQFHLWSQQFLTGAVWLDWFGLFILQNDSLVALWFSLLLVKVYCGKSKIQQQQWPEGDDKAAKIGNCWWGANTQIEIIADVQIVVCMILCKDNHKALTVWQIQASSQTHTYTYTALFTFSWAPFLFFIFSFGHFRDWKWCILVPEGDKDRWGSVQLHYLTSKKDDRTR